MTLSVPTSLAQHRRGARRQIRIGVNLAVRVGQGHPDLLTTVLEAEHLRYPGQRRQFGGAVPPRVHDQPGMRRVQARERTGVIGRKADHLAASVPRSGYEPVTVGRADWGDAGPGQAGKPVLEDDNVVVGGGHLATQTGRPRTQRAARGRRLVGAILALCGDDHPLAGGPVEPQPRGSRVTFGQRPTIRHRRRDVSGQRKEQQVTAIGQGPPRRRRHNAEPYWERLVELPTAFVRDEHRRVESSGRWRGAHRIGPRSSVVSPVRAATPPQLCLRIVAQSLVLGRLAAPPGDDAHQVVVGMSTATSPCRCAKPLSSVANCPSWLRASWAR